MKKVKHPNIIPFIEAFKDEEDNTLCIVIKLIA
jgi:serine/threonine protein kinase